jgi:nucleotide-binding universal stress UspA family protein
MRIVIGIDRSPEAEAACWFVADRSWPPGTRVVLVAATQPRVELASFAAVGVDPLVDDRHAVEALLDQRADIFRRATLPVETEIAAGSAAEVLMASAAGHFADLIVVGSRRRGPLSSAVLGSVSTSLADHAPCPVLVVRTPSATRMLVATDGTHSSRSIPTILATWGPAFRGLPVEVVSVAPRHGFVTPWGAGSAEEAGDGEELELHQGIAEQVADELMELGWAAAAIARVGDPDHEIVAAGEEWGADLIVTGSRGIGTLHRLLGGSVAHEVLLHTRSSVLVMRGQVPAPVGAVRVADGFAAG